MLTMCLIIINLCSKKYFDKKVQKRMNKAFYDDK